MNMLNCITLLLSSSHIDNAPNLVLNPLKIYLQQPREPIANTGHFSFEAETPASTASVQPSLPEDMPRQLLTGLDRDTVTSGLGLMARYLHERHQDITIITIGGLVNVLFLQSQTAYGADFFDVTMRKGQRIMLNEAARHAERGPVPLGNDWFKEPLTLGGRFSWRLRKQLVEEALRQNDVVFEKPGLKLVAAPWEYAMITYMQWLRRGYYDTDHAIIYLHHYLMKNPGNSPPTMADLLALAKKFHLEIDVGYTRMVAIEYRRKYGKAGIAGVEK